MIDKKGRACYVIIIGFILLALSHFTFYFKEPCSKEEYIEHPLSSTLLDGMVPMFMLGIAKLFISLGIYPVVNYLTCEHYFGTAYGFVQVCSNLGYLTGSDV
jgi:hypothetical protein